MKDIKPKNNKKWIKVALVISVFLIMILVGSYIHSDRDNIIQCDDFKDPMIWTTQDRLRNVSLHYEISDVPKPAFDKIIKIFWGDGRSTKQSIGLGTSLSGSIDHQYATNGDKKIEIFLSITNSNTECGLINYVSL